VLSELIEYAYKTVYIYKVFSKRPWHTWWHWCASHCWSSLMHLY